LLGEIALVAIFILAAKIYLSGLGFKIVFRGGWIAAYFIVACVWNLLFLMAFWVLPIGVIAPMVLVATIALCFFMTAHENKWFIFIAGFSLYIMLLLAQVIVKMLLTALNLSPFESSFSAALFSVLVGVVLLLTVSLISKVISVRIEHTLMLVGARQTVPALIAVAANGAISIFIFTLVQNNKIDFAIGTLLIIAILITAVAISIVYFISLSRWAKTEQESTIYRQQARFYDTYLQEKEASYLHGKTLEHDQKQHLIYLLNALEEEKVKEGISYLQHMLKDVSVDKVIRSNNLVVDALLNYTSEQMRKSQIELVASIEVPARVSIADVDFCIVLGNLLTNAIEATQQVEDTQRVIDLTIRYKAGNNLYIRVENPYENALKTKGVGRLASTKESDQERGFGIYSARQVAERYDGALHIKTHEGKFVVEALLYGGSDTNSNGEVASTEAAVMK